MEVIGHKPAALFILHPVIPAPFRNGTQAAHESGQQPAVFSGIIDVFQQYILRPEAEYLGNHKIHMILTRRGIYPLHIPGIQGNRLLTDDMDPSLHGADRIIRMKISGKTDIQDIQLFLLQHFLKIRVQMFVRVFVQTFLTHIAQSHKRGLLHGFPCGYMGAADAADSDETNL